MENNINELVKDLIDGKFDNDQIHEIKTGLENNLSLDRISVYANKNYNWFQMRQIRWGLEKGLDVGLYAKEKYNWEQMFEIRDGLQHGLTKEQVGIYADPKYSPDQMQQIRERLELSQSNEM